MATGKMKCGRNGQCKIERDREGERHREREGKRKGNRWRNIGMEVRRRENQIEKNVGRKERCHAG